MAVSAIADADRFLYLTLAPIDDEQRCLVENLRREAVIYRDSLDKANVKLRRSQAKLDFLMKVMLDGDGLSTKKWKLINDRFAEIDKDVGV